MTRQPDDGEEAQPVATKQQWSVHFLRPGEGTHDAVLVYADNLETAIARGQEKVRGLWPDEEAYFASAAVVVRDNRRADLRIIK